MSGREDTSVSTAPPYGAFLPEGADPLLRPVLPLPAVRDLGRLFRVRITLAVAASTVLGALLARPVYDFSTVAVALGVALLAAGCSAVNQAQEYATDALMPRTANRPVPAGRCSPRGAGLAGAGAILLSLPVLFWAGGPLLVFVGAGIVAVYNGLYTPLKKHTAFALLVGASVGALPPAVGWLAAGGGFPQPFPVMLYGAFFLWQVPHFRLRAERDREEYRRAGLPVLAAVRFRLPGIFSAPALWEYALMLTLMLLAGMFMVHASLRVCAFGAAISIPLGRCLPGTCAARVVDGGMAFAMALVLADRLLY